MGREPGELPPRALGTASRRQFVKGAAVLLGGAGLAGAGVWRYVDGRGESVGTAQSGGNTSWLDELADHVVSGGPGKDGIPAIDEPRFVAAGEMNALNGDDPVFGLVHGGVARAYPQLVLVWHEIVNDKIGGVPISVTYCPLTGSAFGMRGAVDGDALTFGTTGRLVNSNLLMYDRQTESEWPQLAGVAIQGRLRGRRLTVVPLTWTTWARWHRAHPDTTVLSTRTGHVRDYGQDPYGSYTPLSGYYRQDDLLFPVLQRSERFGPKQVVVGVRVGERSAAVVKAHVARRRRIEFTLGGVPLAAVWDDRLAAARIVSRREGDRPAVDFFDVMWFAWYAFYPDTEVIG